VVWGLVKATDDFYEGESVDFLRAEGSADLISCLIYSLTLD
jgi:hypothetical protein